jgi:hypothetical protein
MIHPRGDKKAHRRHTLNPNWNDAGTPDYVGHESGLDFQNRDRAIGVGVANLERLPGHENS